MDLSLSNSLVGGGSMNPDGLSLDLQFAADKKLTARRGPTPVFSRGSSGTFVNGNGLIVGKTTANQLITPSTQDIGSQVTVIVPSSSVVGWVVGQPISLIVDTDGQDDPDATELWLLGNIVSIVGTDLTFTVTARTAQTGTATSWTLGYRGARFDHDPVTLACKGLLIEETKTNLCLRSENFGTTWSTFNSSTSLISQDAPNGDPSAYSVVENTGPNEHSIFQSIAFAGTTNYTFSVFVKAGSRNFVSLVEQSSGGAVRRTFFNLSTGVVGTKNASHTASTQQLPNGWWRLIISFTSGTAASANIAIELASADNVSSYIGNGSGNVFLWGAQLEAGAFATSYIPTTTATAARGADVCSITSSEFNSFYNQSEGTFLSSTQLFSVGNDYSARYWNVSEPSTGSFMRVSVFSQTSTQELSFLVSPTSSIDSTVNSVTSRASRVAGAYQANNARIVKNGTLGILDTSVTPYTSFNNLGIMTSASGTIASLRYYKKRLEDAKLQTLTV